MTEREALTLALEALESKYIVNCGAWRVQQDKAITAIKEALAQPKQKAVAWKLVPVEPTEEMLKAMDECSKEGYDERLYAGHAASVYMAAVDVAPAPAQHEHEIVSAIKTVLMGIDKTESESPDGWWETSTGAEFGAKKLKYVIGLLTMRGQA